MLLSESNVNSQKFCFVTNTYISTFNEENFNDPVIYDNYKE